jgi:hypothetical protein
MYLCARSSVGGRIRSTGPEAVGIGGQGGKGDSVIGSSGSRIGSEVFEEFCVVLYISQAIIGMIGARKNSELGRVTGDMIDGVK